MFLYIILQYSPVKFSKIKFFFLVSFFVFKDLDGSFLSTNDAGEDDSMSMPDAYFEAIGTRPAMPDFDYSHEYDPAIGKRCGFFF